MDGIQGIQKKIQDFESWFRSIKNSTKDVLIKQGKRVVDVTSILTELSADDISEHKVRFRIYIWPFFIFAYIN